MTIQEAKNKLVDLARSQLGYREGANNYTKYAADPMITRLYGWTPQNQPWCCTFVNWCFLTAFGYDAGSKLTYGGSAACRNAADNYKAHNAFTKFPEVGDQSFYYSGGAINHTGIVVAVDGTIFSAVEGNYSDKVSLVMHNIGNSDVAGFGKPNWSLVQSTTSQPEKPSNSGQSQGKTENKSTMDQAKHNWKPETLKYGAKGVNVYVLQSHLVAKNFYANNITKEIDGDFGAKTQAAVNSAKQFYGMMANGECDRPLWMKLLSF